MVGAPNGGGPRRADLRCYPRPPRRDAGALPGTGPTIRHAGVRRPNGATPETLVRSKGRRVVEPHAEVRFVQRMTISSPASGRARTKSEEIVMRCTKRTSA